MIAPARKSFDLSAITIRACAEDDIRAVAEIYGHHVLHSTATFELDPPGLEEMVRRRRVIVDGGHVYLVAEADTAIVGYAYAGAYHGRPGYRFTVENSVYVAPEMHRRGIGKILLDALIEASAKRGFRLMIAVIGDSNQVASIKLHDACGFEHAGTFKNVGYKFDRWLDTVLMQLPLGDGAGSKPED